MVPFREFLRGKREKLAYRLSNTATELGMDTSFLSKIERTASKEMLPNLAKTLEVQEKAVQIEIIKATTLADWGKLKFLQTGLEETLNIIKSHK